MCLLFSKSEPQYAYKRYAYKKNLLSRLLLWHRRRCTQLLHFGLHPTDFVAILFEKKLDDFDQLKPYYDQIQLDNYQKVGNNSSFMRIWIPGCCSIPLYMGIYEKQNLKSFLCKFETQHLVELNVVRPYLEDNVYKRDVVNGRCPGKNRQVLSFVKNCPLSDRYFKY